MLGCGDVLNGTSDGSNYVPEEKTLPLEPEKINRLLGTDISREDMVHYLDLLEIPVEGDNILVPTFRPDLIRMAEIAAAALAEIRAVGADAVRRGLFYRFDDAVRRAPADVDDADAARLARNGARNKDDLPVRAGNALAVGGVARDGDSQTIVFFHIEFLCFT